MLREWLLPRPTPINILFISLAVAVGTMGSGTKHSLPLSEAADPTQAWHIKEAQVVAIALKENDIN